MKQCIAVAVIIGVLVSGCTGSFVLTRKVYEFHRNQEGKWVDELFFLGAVILPVYGLAGLGDAIIFNTIEFWSDENPLQAKKSLSNDVVMEYESSKSSVTVSGAMVREQEKGLTFTRSSEGVVVHDESGKLIYISKTDADGGISIYDGSHRLIRRFSPEQMKLARQKILTANNVVR